MINAPVLHVNGDHPEGVYFLFCLFQYVRKRLIGNKMWSVLWILLFGLGTISARFVCFLVTGRVIRIKLTMVGHHRGSFGLSTMVCSSLPSSSLTLPNASFEGGKISNSCFHTSSLSEHCIYRHNELDLPGITSPLMYEKIAARQSVPQLYEAKLIVRLPSTSLPPPCPS